NGPTALARPFGPPWKGGAPPGFVQRHFRHLVEQGAECATCPWQNSCAGYFKWPDPAYSCGGVKRLFSRLQAAADEIARELRDYGGTSPTATEAKNHEGDALDRGTGAP